MTILFPLIATGTTALSALLSGCTHYKKTDVSYSLELAMTLHPTFQVDSAQKRGSKDEDLEQVEFTSVNVLLPLDLNLYRSNLDTSAVDPGKLKRKIDFGLVPWLALLYLGTFFIHRRCKVV